MGFNLRFRVAALIAFSAGGVLLNPSIARACTTGSQCATGFCANGRCYVSVTDLGSTQGFSNANYINNHGVVVGSDVPPAAGIYQNGYPGSRAFRWTQSEGQSFVPFAGSQSCADAVNEDG